jgi:hypothetical protein
MFVIPPSPVTQSEYLAALSTSRFGKSTVRDRKVRRSARARRASLLRKGGRA